MRKSFVMFVLVIMITSLILSPAQAYTDVMNTGQDGEKEINTNLENEGGTDTSQNVDDNKQTGEEITFEDKNLELLIREQVGKISGDLLPGDVEKITNLDARYKEITSLEGIQYLTNLTTLYLGGNQITDVKPLSSLENLKSLELYSNRISNIDPLGSLIHLNSLDISNNIVKELDALKDLANLKELDLRSNRISDIQPLETLTNLKNIDLSNNLIEDISALVKISNDGGLGKYTEYGYERNSTIDVTNNLLSDSQEGQDVKDAQTLIDNGAQVSFNPQKEVIKVTGLELNPQNLTLSVDQTYALKAAVQPYEATNRNVNWTSSDESVASVDENGLVTAISEGEAIIKATTQDGEFEDSSKITVFSDEVVNFADPNLTALIRDRIQKETGEILKSDLFGITSLDAANKEISNLQGIENLVNLQSLDLYNNQIEEISPLLTLTNLYSLNISNNYLNVSQGSEADNIIKKIEEQAKYVYFKPQKSKVTGVQIYTGHNKENGDLHQLGLVKEKYDNIQLDARVLPDNGNVNNHVTWSSSNEEVVTVDENGKVKAQSEGKATITVTTEEGDYQDRIEVVVLSDDAVSFEDEILENKIRVMVKRVNGDVRVSDVLPIMDLNLDGAISDITGLEKFTNLQGLSIYGKTDMKDLSKLGELTNLSELNLRNSGITDIRFLEDLKNLTYLDLSHNKIRDIEVLSFHPNLTHLTLRGNQITNIIPLEHLNNLKYLSLESNQIEDVSALARNSGLDEKSSVYLSYNLLDFSQGTQNAIDIQTLLDNGVYVSYDPQQEPVKVDGITLNPTKLVLQLDQSYSLQAEVHPYHASNKSLNWTSSDENIAKVDQNGLITAVSEGEVIITAETDDGEHKATTEVIVYKDEVIHFSDENLERQIRHEIGKLIGDIKISDALKIEHLYLPHQNIKSIEGLEYFTNLRTLILPGNQIKDPSVIGNLKNLQELNLSDTGITDFSFLEDLKNLSGLWLANNNISDVSSIAVSDGLYNLDLTGNEIKDISSLVKKFDKHLYENKRIDLSGNYLNLSQDSQNAKDIQALLDKGIRVTYLPQKALDSGNESGEGNPTPKPPINEGNEEPTPTPPTSGDNEEPTSTPPTNGDNEEPVEKPTDNDPSGDEEKEPVQEVKFKDVPKNHRFIEEIGYLSSRKIINGFLDGTFKPGDVVTRAQAAIMIGGALGLDSEPKSKSFKDVSTEVMGSGYIESAVEKGIIKGFPNGTYRPHEPVTRAQMAIFLDRAFELTESKIDPFDDVTPNMKAYQAILNLAGEGITYGFTETTFIPEESVTRGQFSAFLARTLEPSFRK